MVRLVLQVYRKPTTLFCIFVTGKKVKQRFYGPYEIIKKMPYGRYEMRKLDDSKEGPRVTTSAADVLKPWGHSGRM